MSKPNANAKRPMPLNVSTETFIGEWGRCIDDKASDTTELIKMLQPFVTHWESQLRNQTQAYHINYVTLCKLLSSDIDSSLSMIRAWLNWADNTSTVQNELTFLFLERVRKFKYYPTLAKPIMVEYVIARDFKLALRQYITSIWRKTNRDAHFQAEYDVDYDEEIVYDYSDSIIVRDLKLDSWQNYLIDLILSNYSTVERSNLTLMHRRNLYTEENKIWDLIRLKLLDSSAQEDQ